MLRGMKSSLVRRAAALSLFIPLAHAADPEWARFRGPAGTGIGAAAEVPSAITERHFRWNIELPGRGHASPVLWGAKVFTACEDEPGKRRSIACLDAESGKLLWNTWLPCDAQRMHGDNSLAAATPAADAQAIYIGWVSGNRVEAAAISHDGKPLWRRDLGAFKATHGPGASVVVAGDTVVITNDQESPDAAIHGLDRGTGEVRWRIARRSGQPSYATPAMRSGRDGRTELVVASPAHGLTGIDPQSGKELWSAGDLFTLNVVASPVLGDDLVLATAGRGGEREAAVVRLDGETARLAYRPATKLPYVPTPVVVGANVFLWDDQGTVTCFDFKTGTTAWSQRVTGPTYTSPVSDGKRLFGISRKGEMVVLAATTDFRELGRCQLPEGTHATPAIARGSLFVRTFTRLIRIGSAP